MTREDSPADVRTVQVGNYRFTGKILGKGTFATVEEAIHLDLKVKVAVKMINLVKCNAYVQKHIKREASILSRVNHPHVLRVFETMSFNNTHCMVMELMDGGDLCSFLQRQRGRRLDEKTTRFFSRQLTTGLAYLHTRGIVHRDLKLENIMLDTRQEHVKLVDFGLSSQWSPESPLSTLCGSPEYSAPELFKPGSRYGPEVDMWALGVVVYVMATGSLPFPCANSIMKIPEQKCVFIKMINKGLSQPHLEKVKIFSSSFATLLKGLIQPVVSERISVYEALKNPWLSNRNHWTYQDFDTLDSHDEDKVLRQVCNVLKLSEDIVKLDLQLRPCGEVAGFYKILAYQQTQPKKKPIVGRDTKSNTSSCPSTAKHSNRICIVGAASRLNEVVRGKRTCKSKLDTRATTQPLPNPQNSYRNGKTDETKLSLEKKSPTKILPLKCKMFDDVSSLSPKSTARDSEKSPSPMKFKDKFSSIQQPILPSKLKLKSPICGMNSARMPLRVG